MALAAWQDSDDEFAEEEEARFSGKTALLVVIDVTPKMFESWGAVDGGGDSEEQEGSGGDKSNCPFSAAIKCCESMWRSKVVSNAKDLVSILLLGTKKSQNPSSFPNMFQLQGLSAVTVDMIKELIEIRKNADGDFNGFKNKIGSSEDYDLKNLFWLAKIIFDEKKTQTFAKKIIFFTCEDNPHAAKPTLQQDAISKFKDLGKIDLNIVSFKEDFDFNKFYSNILEDGSSVIHSNSNDLESLMKVVRMKQKLRRPLTRTVFEILPGVTIGVGYYSFVRPAQQPKYVSINRRNNETVEKVTNVFRTDTALPVLKSEERKMVEVQGEKAVFTPQEIKDIKYSVGSTGLKLLGFLNAEAFDSFKWYRSPGYFLYPDEDSIEGSKDLFSTLAKRCHALKKIPLVRMVLSRGKTPKLACLLPSIPDIDEDGVVKDQIFPQGFHIFNIPFCDEIRKMDFELSGASAPPEMIDLMEKLVKKLTHRKFDVLDVKNPQLQCKWMKLEEEALEEKADDEEFMDLSEPNEELMKERLGMLPNCIENAAKRAGDWFSDTRASSTVTVDVPMEAKHGRLNRCTVAVLKEFLQSRKVKYPNLPRKANLIELVNQTLGIDN